ILGGTGILACAHYPHRQECLCHQGNAANRVNFATLPQSATTTGTDIRGILDMDRAATAASHPRRIAPTAPRILAAVAVVFLVVFLFLRVGFVEPFGVPTGSMAPTLIGNHRETGCPRCNSPIRVGIPTAGERPGFYADIPCPNCGYRANLGDAREINGDRLLVDKNVYQLRRPRRWEVAVFRCPADLAKPYVKRVIGLPNEEISIRDGDVFANGELLRKSLREVRETCIPVLDMAYIPNPGGWSRRWYVYPAEADARLPRGAEPQPADETILQNGSLVLDASAAS